jgi:hypothetical protein
MYCRWSMRSWAIFFNWPLLILNLLAKDHAWCTFFFPTPMNTPHNNNVCKTVTSLARKAKTE